MPCGYSWSTYQGQVRQLLHGVKTTGSVQVARRLAALALPDLATCEQVFQEARVLVPAPSSKRANRIRGFSPAAVFAKALVRRAGQLGLVLIVQHPLRFERLTQNQKRLNKLDRQANLAGSMVAVAPPAGSSFGTAVVLVDDVVTTGATLAECSRALSQAGWQPLSFVTFAETL